MPSKGKEEPMPSKQPGVPRGSAAPGVVLTIPPDRIPERQWELMAGYGADGSVLTLRDVIARQDATVRTLDALSDDEFAELTVQRIRGQRSYHIKILGLGELNRDEAVAEVKKRSDAGRTLMEIERNILRMVIEDARSEASGRTNP